MNIFKVIDPGKTYCFSDEKTESEEVFYEQLTTVLSREFSNLLGKSLS